MHMSKEEALLATAKKFTNLKDGKVNSGIGVITIINHYESLLENTKPAAEFTKSGIIQNFLEDELNYMYMQELDASDSL